MTSEFFERCSKAGCVVLPVKTYTDYVDGDIDDSLFAGIKYAAVIFAEYAVGPDYWFMIEESSMGQENLYGSPLEALEAFERTAQRRNG